MRAGIKHAGTTRLASARRFRDDRVGKATYRACLSPASTRGRRPKGTAPGLLAAKRIHVPRAKTRVAATEARVVVAKPSATKARVAVAKPCGLAEPCTSKCPASHLGGGIIIPATSRMQEPV